MLKYCQRALKYSPKVHIGHSSSELLKQRNSRISIRQAVVYSGETGNDVSDWR